MVNGFHPDDLINHLLIVAVNVFNEIKLGVSWTNNQNFLSALHCLDHFVIEMLIFLVRDQHQLPHAYCVNDGVVYWGAQWKTLYHQS